MTPLDDDVLTALRAARPAPGYQPTATSPQAMAMLARILHTRPDQVPRVTRRLAPGVSRRRLLLAGLPAAAGAAAATVVAVSVASSGPGSTRPAVSSVRAAVLDAFQRDSGDIVATTRTIHWFKGPVMTQRAWAYPAFPALGQQIRLRLFILRDGVPESDTESIYFQNAAAGRLTQPTTEGPRSAEIIDVQYTTRTWSRQRSASVLLAGNLSPSLIQDQIASGGFTVAGTVRLRGRPAIKLTWTRSPGRLTVTTSLWVDARTYLPLRSATTIRAGLHNMLLETDTTQYQILPATQANLDLLEPPIPAGFTRAATSPHF
jgi:hypothetical protein